MFKEIIKPSDCAVCQFCCQFTEENLWDRPLFTEESKNKISEKYSAVIFEPMKSLWAPQLIHEGILYKCPFLDSKIGCTLGELKPFDCRLWPLYVMKKGSDIIFAQSSDCMPANIAADEKMIEIINTHFELITEFHKQYPQYIKNYIYGYRIWRKIDTASVFWGMEECESL